VSPFPESMYIWFDSRGNGETSPPLRGGIIALPGDNAFSDWSHLYGG